MATSSRKDDDKKNLRELLKSLQIPYWKGHKIRVLSERSFDAKYLSRKYRLKIKTVHRIILWKGHTNELPYINTDNPRRYYENEQDIIHALDPLYRAEDLKGEELEILKNLSDT